MVTQFIAAFDDIVIGRYNKAREEKDKIDVRYLYAPKQRVLHDIVNENKTITLPAVAISIGSVSRDTSRVFNKLDGFYYAGTSGNEKTSKHVKAPVPVNISIKMSVISRYQTDMDQILSNFIPFSNPYVVISWKVPKKFNLAVDQEIRSEVLWDGNVSLSYPTELASTNKARITADTSFTIKGWLFKDEDDPVGNIFFIDQNFYAEDLIEEYDTLSAIPLSGTQSEFFELSGSPKVTDTFYNSVRLYEDMLLKVTSISGTNTDTVILNGLGFNTTQHVLLSSNNTSNVNALTSLPSTTRQPAISGKLIPFTIVNDNSLTFNLPPLSGIGKVRFIPYNKAGYSFSDDVAPTASRVNTVNIEISNNISDMEGDWHYREEKQTLYPYGRYVKNGGSEYFFWTGDRWGFKGDGAPSHLPSSVTEEAGWWSAEIGLWSDIASGQGNETFISTDNVTFTPSAAEPITTNRPFIRVVS